MRVKKKHRLGSKKAQAVKEQLQAMKPLIFVTACTFSVPHMAEESLIKTGEEMGVNVRVETNSGAISVEHH